MISRLSRYIVTVGVFVFAALMLLHRLGSYPPGLDPDAAQEGLEALKLLRYGIPPFYVAINSSVDPLFIYSAIPAIGLLGPGAFTLRLLSAFYALLGFAATYAAVLAVGRRQFESSSLHLIAVMAVAALATSQSIVFFNRMGLRFSTLPLFEMAAIVALARAIRLGHRGAWILAAVLAGLTQYTYSSSRLLPLLYAIHFALLAPRGWWKSRLLVRQLLLCVAIAVAVLLPQIIWFAQFPSTFYARGTQTSIVNNPLYAEAGLWATVADKVSKYLVILHSQWYGQYNHLQEPLFAPLFYYGFLLGVLAAAIHFRRKLPWLILTGLAVMILPELMAGERTYPHELRLVGAYPFAAMLAGLGLAEVVHRLSFLRRSRTALAASLVAVLMLTGLTQAIDFFSEETNYGRMRWNGNTWLRRVDAGVGKLIAAGTDHYLLPLENFGDTPVKFLASRRIERIVSAVQSDGSVVVPIAAGEPITLLLPRGDGDEPWAGDPTRWVVIAERVAYLLPPLNAEQVLPLLPDQDDSTAVFGVGIDSNVRLGHARVLRWQQWPTEQNAAPQRMTDGCFEAGMCLTGVSYSRQNLIAGERVTAHLHWLVRKPVKDDLIMFVHLLDGEGNALSGVNEYPLKGGLQTYEWNPGGIVITSAQLDIPPDAPPGRYGLEVGFYPPHAVLPVKVVTDEGSVVGERLVYYHLKISRQPVSLPHDHTPAHITFAEPIELVAYRIDSLPESGAPLTLTLWYRATGEVSVDWTAFLHLTTASDNTALVGQADAQITGGAYPPSIWNDGELVADVVSIYASELPAGDYAVWFGLYSPITFQRLVILNSPNPMHEDRALLIEFSHNP